MPAFQFRYHVGHRDSLLIMTHAILFHDRDRAAVDTTCYINTMRRLAYLPDAGVEMPAHENIPVGGCAAPINPMRGFCIPAWED